MKQLLIAALMVGLNIGISHAQIRPASPNGFELTEHALEAATIRLFLRSDGSGSAVARQCNDCKPIRLVVHPEMIVRRGGQSVKWNTDLNFTGELVYVFYDSQSLRINRIEVP